MFTWSRWTWFGSFFLNNVCGEHLRKVLKFEYDTWKREGTYPSTTEVSQQHGTNQVQVHVYLTSINIKDSNG